MATTVSSEVFPAGVASFDPTEHSVLIWAALEGADGCEWQVATDEAFERVVAHGHAERVPGAPAVTVEVTGLAAGRTHWYRFHAGGRTTPVGRTRTLPGGDADRLRIGVTCCARYGQSDFAVYRELAAADVDLVVHLGDYIYEDTKSDVEGREPRPDHDCVSLDDYRTRHLQSRRDPDLALLHRRHPMVVILDDHDLADNAHRDGAADHDGSTQGPWSARRDAALRAHQEFLPKRLAVADDPGTGWRSLDAGSLVRILATETRAQRDAQAGLPGTPDADDPRRTMLGADQRDWLVPVLADAAPRWTLLLSGTVMSELTIDAPDELGGALPEKYTVESGRAMNTDQWDGYSAERDVLVAAARRRGGATVVLSGDIHSSWAIEGPADDDGAVAIELTCPPAATTPLGQLLPPGAGALLERTVVDRLDQVRWMSAMHRGLVILDLTRERVQVSYWWVDDEVRLGHRFEVPAGDLPMHLVDPVPAAAAPTAEVSTQGRWPSRAVVAALVGSAVAAATVGAAAAAAVARRRRS